MPVTRRASRGASAAQAPSTIYSTYNEIVKMIQENPHRVRRVPKRAREAETTLAAEKEKEGARNWCDYHTTEDCDCAHCWTLDWSEGKFFSHIMQCIYRIESRHPAGWECPLCKSSTFRECQGMCYANPIPTAFLRDMSGNKLRTLHLNTLMRICEEFC